MSTKNKNRKKVFNIFLTIFIITSINLVLNFTLSKNSTGIDLVINGFPVVLSMLTCVWIKFKR